jgi:acyl-CoA synthetase (AMP-forming)/AMP-acid ligase II
MRLDNADPETLALVSEGGAISYAQLAGAAAVDSLASVARRDSVALRLKDAQKLALAIATLSGRAGRLFLLSYDTDHEIARTLLDRFRPDVVLTDQPSAMAETSADVVPWTDSDLPVFPPALGAEVPERQTGWVLATSGTTGVPKLVEHSFASLTRTVRSDPSSKRIERWGQLFNMCRFAGVQVLLQSLIGGNSLLLPDTAWPLDRQIEFLARNGCTALSATPTLWRKILMTPQSKALDLVQVTLGGEIADDQILRSLAGRFPNARIVHIYASTEAGAAFSVRDGRAGFPVRYLTEPPKGIEIKIVDDRLYVRNGKVVPHYLGDDNRFADDEGFVDTGDAVRISGDRCYFLGRANGTINVGGNKLFPEEVEAVLLEHRSVRFARVSSKPSPITGQLVIADVVPLSDEADARALVRDLTAHCRDRLERWKVPASIRILSTLETNAGGKVARRSI